MVTAVQNWLAVLRRGFVSEASLSGDGKGKGRYPHGRDRRVVSGPHSLESQAFQTPDETRHRDHTRAAVEASPRRHMAQHHEAGRTEVTTHSLHFAIVVEVRRHAFVGCVVDEIWCEYSGRTADEALQNTIAGLEFHLHGLIEDGDPLPQPSARIAEIEVSVPELYGPAQSATYKIVVERAPKNYAAYVPDLPGCVSAADTFDETLTMMQEAIEGHLELMAEDREPLPPKAALVEMVKVDIPRSAVAEVAEVAD